MILSCTSQDSMVLFGNNNYKRTKTKSLRSVSSVCPHNRCVPGSCQYTVSPGARYRHATKYKSGDIICTFETVLLKTSPIKHCVIICDNNASATCCELIDWQIFGPRRHHTTMNKLGFRMAGRGSGNLITAFPGVTEKDGGSKRTNMGGRERSGVGWGGVGALFLFF